MIESVSIDVAVFLKQIEALRKQNENLKLRLDGELEKNQSLEKEIEILKLQGQREVLKLRKPKERKSGEYLELKSNGKRKAQKADSIKSYDDFQTIKNYFEERGSYRNKAMWIVGTGTGLRFSDISLIKYKTILNEDNTFRERFKLYEKKTSKLQNCLITPVVKEALKEYLDSIGWKFNRDDYIFNITNKSAWRILNAARDATNVQINMGTHTMRKSFVTIAYCLGGYSQLDNRLEVLQGILNHSSSLITRRYIGIEQDMYDKARMIVSDFLEGKTDVNILEFKEDTTIQSVLEKLDKLEEILTDAA